MTAFGYFCFATFCVTLVISSIVPNTRERRGASCTVDGSVRSDGTNFTRPSTGPCVFYTCTDGQVLPAGYGCLRGTTCHPVGDVFMLGCIERTCTVTNGRFDYVITDEGCVGRDGTSCISVGETFKEGCFSYICEKESQSEFSVSFHTRQTDWGCQLGDHCVPVGHEELQGCTKVQCQRHGLSVGFYTVSEACQIGSDCVEVGDSKVVECRTLTCQKENINGLSLLNVQPTNIQCMDADDMCHGDGGSFDMLVNGKRQHNCTCSISDLAIQYRCPSRN